MDWVLLVRDAVSDKVIVLQALIPRSEMVFDTLLCPSNDIKDSCICLEVTVEDSKGACVGVLAQFPKMEIELDTRDDCGLHKEKQYENGGLRLVVEYHRARIGESRRSTGDNTWQLHSIAIEFLTVPPMLKAIARHLEHRYRFESIEKEFAIVSDAIRIAMDEEQKLKLALVDVKCVLSEQRKTLTSIEKRLIESKDAYDQTLAAIATSSSTMTNILS